VDWTTMNMPAARTDGLVVERLSAETLVYDLENDEAHHLNPTAAAVFELCDGQLSLDQLIEQLARQLGQPVGAETVRAAVSLLADRKLLVATPDTREGISRRDVVRKAAKVGAAAAVAAPVIQSIVAPTPAHAQSAGCSRTGEPCQVDEDCCGDRLCANLNGSMECINLS
jgi:hypothetical protein